MQCKSCNYPDSRVVETKKDDRTNQITRRRECIKCGHRYTTIEDHRADKKSSYETPKPLQVLPK